MSEFPDWLKAAVHSLRITAVIDRTPEQVAKGIHEALEIAEVRKYATPESRFTFTVSGATDEDVAEIRRHLSELENSIVEIERKFERHCWLRGIAHDWTPWKLWKANRAYRISRRECKRCGWPGHHKYEWFE